MIWAMEEKTYSQARACALIGLAPKAFRYQAKREGDEAFRKRLRELAGERRRFGYRRLHLLLCREGMRLNPLQGGASGRSQARRTQADIS